MNAPAKAPASAPRNGAAPPARRRRRRSREGRDTALVVGAALLAVASVILGALAAWPIYQTPRVWAVAGIGGAIAFLLVWAGYRRGWGPLTLVALLGGFVLLVVPLAVPQALGAGPLGALRGLGDGLAAVALGWKQLLTLSLPVGSYQAVLVPLLVTMLASVAGVAALALRSSRLAPLAALPMLLPVFFGTVFGSSTVSDPLVLGPLAVTAPRELGLWILAAGTAAVWIAWSSTAERRSALRRGRLSAADLATEGGAARQGESAVRRNSVVRGAVAALTVVLALVAGVVLAPMLDGGSRAVPRDRIDPEIVVRDQVSPLAAYRTWKRDDVFAAELFFVDSEDRLPGRLRLAVLDSYDGVDFFVGDASSSGRFTRFPSGSAIADPSDVRIEIAEGYRDIWVPIAPPLAGPPSFEGERAAQLADSFFLNRDAGSAVAVPTVRGLRAGDAYAVTMSAAADATLSDRPASESSLIDLEQMPQLAQWLKAQELPATGDGLTTAIERLRERGYLSHSLTDGEGERAWIAELAQEHGTRFVTSAGGHSMARIEQLFTQLNEQESAAGEFADEQMLVAGIGDDEQFAAAGALIARALGYDSRVVVGVRLGDEDAGVPGVPACVDTCRGENLSAWIEARGADGVWAPLDVTPQVDVPPSLLEKGEQLPEFPTQPEERDATESDPAVGMSEQESGESEESETDGLAALWPVLRAIGLGLLALLLLALPLLFLPLAKRLRTRRRAAQMLPELRALNDWDRLIDDAVDAGAKLPAGGSRRDIADQLGVPGGEWMAWIVDRAVYAREGISDAEADRLAGAVDAELAARRADRGLWRRVRAAYSFRSLRVPLRLERVRLLRKRGS